jgi:hypothetical protein
MLDKAFMCLKMLNALRRCLMILDLVLAKQLL